MSDTPKPVDPTRPSTPTGPAAAPTDPVRADEAPAAAEPDPNAEWLSIKVVEDEEEARLIIGFLRANGFDARVESRYSHEFPTHMGRLGEIEIELPAAQAAEAKRVLEERERESASAADEAPPGP